MTQKEKPLISVITPTYNAERFIEETIDSVLAQTYDHWEMILVDDASQDQTVEIVEKYSRQDERIKLIQLEENSGSAVARNTAMDHANGRFIAFLDSDDLWLPEKLATQLSFMLENNVAFSFTQYRRMTEEGRLTNGVSKMKMQVEYDELMKQCIIGCLTVMLDMERVGHERMVNIRTRQDYVFWLTIMKKGIPAYGIPEVLAHYRLVDNSISSNKLKAAKRNWEVYYKIEEQSLLRSMWYFANYSIRSIIQVLKFKFVK